MISPNMSNPEIINGRLDEPFLWMEGNCDLVGRILMRHRDNLLKRDKKRQSDQFWNLSVRSLSEMPLCDAMGVMVKVANLPGYELVDSCNGFVKGDDANGWLGSEYHSFGFDRLRDRVYCLTAGQFVLPDLQMRIGERVEMMAKVAPDIVRVYFGGLAMLSGERKEIENRLGLKYMVMENGVWM